MRAYPRARDAILYLYAHSTRVLATSVRAKIETLARTVQRTKGKNEGKVSPRGVREVSPVPKILRVTGNANALMGSAFESLT